MPENVNPVVPLRISKELNNLQFTMIDTNGLSLPLAYREADAPIVKAIFQDEEHLIPVDNFQPKLILDCGGNIGCAALYYAIKFPDAQIYSIEPEKNNFRLLKYNTALYDNIHAINSALWDKETFIRVEDRGFGIAGFMTFETTEDDPAAFKTVTISKLLQESGFEEIDLLKIDIEGAEKEVFSADDVDEWLSKVKVLTIELHDRMKDGCSYEFFRAVSKYHWRFEFRGENLVFVRKN